MQLPPPPSHHPYGFGLTLAVMALQQAAPERCVAVLATLRDPNTRPARHRRLIMDYVEHRIAASHGH